MTLRGKILAGFMGMLVLVCGLGFIGYYSTNVMERQANQSSTITDSLISMFSAQGAQLRFVLWSDTSFAKEFHAQMKRADEMADQAKKYMDTSARLQRTDQYRKTLDEYSSYFNRLEEINASNSTHRQALKKALRSIDVGLSKLSEAVTELAASELTPRMFSLQTRSLTLQNNLQLSRLEMALFEIEPTREQSDKVLQSMQAVQKQLETLRIDLRRPDTQDLITSMLPQIEASIRHLQAFTSLQLQRQQILAEIRKLVDNAVTQVSTLSNLADTSVAEASTSANVQILSVMFLALAVGLVAAWFISTNVQAQLGMDPARLQELARRVTHGDYAIDDGKPKNGVYKYLVDMVQALETHITNAQKESERAAEESRNAREAMQRAEAAGTEAQAKTEAMLKAADELERVVGIVSSASSQLSAQIEQSEHGASEQASRVTETATAMEEMNSTVIEVAKNAGQASDVSARTRAKADSGAGIVEKAVVSIKQVQKESEALRRDMADLTEQAQSISQVMGVISDIADQTNLLALNAAIEAARAGEAGRGFAVVADEVRKLAEKTMTSTTDVGNAIKSIQASATRSMEQVDRAVKAVEEATGFANQSGEALKEIVSMADATADQVRGIATASEQQSASSEEINRSITQVNTIADQTVLAMREAARAVSDLANQAQVLTGLIEDMKRG